MHIQRISSNQYPANTNFTAITPKAKEFCQNLDKEFLKEAKKQGFSLSTIETIVERMQLSPSFERKTFEEVCGELSQKFQCITELIRSGKTEQELRSLLKLPIKSIKSMFFQFDLAKRNKQILERYEQGCSLREISKEFDIAGETIRLLLKENGINLREQSQRAHNRVVEMLSQGYDEIEIAKETKLSPCTIRTIRHQLRVEGMAVPTRLEARDNKVLELLMQGVKKCEVAKQMNLRPTIIQKIARENLEKLKNKQIADLMACLNKGLSTKETAIKVNTSPATVKRIAQKCNINLKKDFTDRNAAIIESLKTKSAQEVAKEYGLKYQTVLNIKYLAQKDTAKLV